MGTIATRQSTPALRWTFGGLAAAAAILVALIVFEQPPFGPGQVVYRFPTTPPPSAVALGPVIRAEGSEDALGVGTWIETSDASRQITIGESLGRLTLAARSRLQVRHSREDETRLYLARGSLEAFVSADARPRFFQVDTDAARCVDLGCRYTLAVADDGVATVRVTTGQVAFEDGAREVYVPAGATCVARPGAGPGTPRFEDARRDLQAAFDAYDLAAKAEPERRAALAGAALAAVQDLRDTLPAWHLLQEGNTSIVRAAAARLEAVAGPCEAPAGSDAAAVREAWKARLESGW
jgi:hypothetical protein